MKVLPTWLADMFYTEKIDTFNYKNYVENDLAYVVSQPGGSVWVDDTTNVNRIFDSRLTYNKGAFLVRYAEMDAWRQPFL
jgi:hypothetical protein